MTGSNCNPGCHRQRYLGGSRLKIRLAERWEPPPGIEPRTCSLRAKVVTAVIWANSLVAPSAAGRTRPGMSAQALPGCHSVCQSRRRGPSTAVQRSGLCPDESIVADHWLHSAHRPRVSRVEQAKHFYYLSFCR